MATKTWAGTGGVDFNWSTALNWAPSGVPAAVDDVVFNTGSNNCNLSTSTDNIRTLTMTNGWTGLLTGGNRIYVIGEVGVPTDFRLDTHGNHTFSTDIAIGQSSSIVYVYPPTVHTKIGFRHNNGGIQYYMRPILQTSGSIGLYFSSNEVHMDGLTDNAGFTHYLGNDDYMNSSNVYWGNCNIILSVGRLYTRISTAPASNNSSMDITFQGITSGEKTLNHGTATPLTMRDLIYWADGVNNSGKLAVGGSYSGTYSFNRLIMHPDHPGIKSIEFLPAKTTTFRAAANGFENGTNMATIFSRTAGTPTILANSNASVVNQCDWLNLKDITFTGLWEIGDNNIVQTKVTGCRVKASGMRFGD